MNWPTSTLEEVCVFIKNGKSIQQTKEVDGLPITRIETIASQTIDDDRVGYAGLSEADADGFLLQRGDILLSHINSLEHLGKTALYEGHPEKLVHGMNLLNLRPDGNTVDCRYLLHVLRAPETKSKLLRISNKSVNQASIAAGNLKKVAIPLPPLVEQRRIAAILDMADALRAKRREAIAKLDQLLQSVFLEMFGDPVANSKGWSEATLADLADFENGDRSSNYPSKEDIIGEGVPFLSTKNIRSHTLSLEGLQFISREKFGSLSRGKLRRGDLIITLRGTLGACCIYDCHFETGFINAQMMILRPHPERVSGGFLHSLLTSYPVQQIFRRESTGAAVPQLTAGGLSKLSLCLPPKDLQESFVRIRERLQTMKNAQLASELRIEVLFSGIQNHAFENGA